MIRHAISSNTFIRVIENIFNKFDIKMDDKYKDILSILIPGLIYRDGKIMILSATITQINKIIKTKNENIDFISILLGFDIITHIDKYGTITIPLAILLNKITINKETICINGEDVLRKKVLTNAPSTLILSELLSHLGIPKGLSIPIISLVLDLADSKVDEEFKIMSSNSIAFKGYKMSDTKKVLKQMEFDKIILNIMILLVINYIGLNIGSSIVLVNIISELTKQIQYNHKTKCVKGFLK